MFIKMVNYYDYQTQVNTNANNDSNNNEKEGSHPVSVIAILGFLQVLDSTQLHNG